MKKLLIFALILTLALCVAACDKTPDETPTDAVIKVSGMTEDGGSCLDRKKLKIFEKTFQKPIDKSNVMCYNVRVVKRAASPKPCGEDQKSFLKNFSKTY